VLVVAYQVHTAAISVAASAVQKCNVFTTIQQCYAVTTTQTCNAFAAGRSCAHQREEGGVLAGSRANQRRAQPAPAAGMARDVTVATRHTSHVTRHTSHVTRHTSHVTRHTSHVTLHTSHPPQEVHVIGYPLGGEGISITAGVASSHVTRHTSHVTRHTEQRNTSHVTRHTSHVTRFRRGFTR